jgi:hypothetical protein
LCTEEDSYAQAFNMLSGDRRSGWDEKRLASRAFAGEVEGAAPPVWDACLLYGQETAWGDEPPRPTSSGYTVYGAREELEENFLRLLE